MDSKYFLIVRNLEDTMLQPQHQRSFLKQVKKYKTRKKPQTFNFNNYMAKISSQMTNGN